MQLTERLKLELGSEEGSPRLADWVNRAALDIIGEGTADPAVLQLLVRALIQPPYLKAGFGYKFGSLDGELTVLAKSLQNLL